MTKTILCASISILALCVPLVSAQAQTANDWFEAATPADRDAAFEALRGRPDDNQKRFETGAVQFFTALETLSAGLHRYGFHTPGRVIDDSLPILIPENPSPETLTYDGFRALLETFETEIDDARAALSQVDPSDPVSIDIDFATTRLTMGARDNEAHIVPFSAVLAALDGAPPPADQPPVTFRFDNADAIWLQGYCHVILSQLDMILAHDFEPLFDGTFHVFFNQEGFDVPAAFARFGNGFADGRFQGDFLDVIAFIHLLNLPVAEPERRADILDHWRNVIALSRQNWAAIRAETDNEREWLPGPHQKGGHALTTLQVTEETVEGWMEALTLFEAVLDGEALIPHPRFPAGGFDLPAYLQSDTPFDPVLLATGQAALPFMREGRIITPEQWRAITERLGGGNAAAFAFWFN